MVPCGDALFSSRTLGRVGSPRQVGVCFCVLTMARCSQTTAEARRPAKRRGRSPAGLVAQDVRGGRALPLLSGPCPCVHTGHPETCEPLGSSGLTLWSPGRSRSFKGNLSPVEEWLGDEQAGPRHLIPSEGRQVRQSPAWGDSQEHSAVDGVCSVACSPGSA